MDMNSDYEVIVVGGGPGGSTAARLCAQAGVKTLLIEKERLPRYKPCGGCLSAKTVRLLGLDLSPVIENTIYGAKFTYCSEDPFFVESKNPIAFLVMRDRFDQFLVDRALEAGTRVLDGEKVIRVGEGADGVKIESASGLKFRCQVLIGADGSESMVARFLSLRPRKNGGYGVAVESETPFDSSVPFPKEELKFVHLDFGSVPNGYGWVFPKKEWLSIGIGGMFRETKKMNPRHYFKSFVKGLSYLPEGGPEKVMGHPLPSFYDEKQKVSQGRFLLVGDAAHLMDPLQGEGIYYAVRSGMLAAESILGWKKEGTLPSDVYQKAVHLEICENLKWALALSHTVFRFTKLAYATLKRYPELGEIYIQVLEGNETYQGFVIKVKERMKDFLKGKLRGKIKRVMAGT